MSTDNNIIGKTYQTVNEIKQLLNSSTISGAFSEIDYGWRMQTLITDRVNEMYYCVLSVYDPYADKTTYVISGQNGKIIYSTDLKTWETSSVPSGFNSTLDGITYKINTSVSGGVTTYITTFIVAGGDSILYTNDLTSGWTLKDVGVEVNTTLGLTPIICVSDELNTVYIAGSDSGALVFSNNLNTGWKISYPLSSQGNPKIRFLIHTQDGFIIVANDGYIAWSNGIQTSLDNDTGVYSSVTWNVSKPGGTSNIQSISYNDTNGTYVAVGDNGLIIYTQNLSSSWSTSNSGVSHSIQNVIYDKDLDLYVAATVGGDIIMSSDLTKQWYKIGSDTVKNLQYITYDSVNKIFVIVGDSVIAEGISPTYITRTKIIDDVLRIQYNTSSVIMSKIQNNPYNYLGFGNWSMSFDNVSSIYTYTRLS